MPPNVVQLGNDTASLVSTVVQVEWAWSILTLVCLTSLALVEAWAFAESCAPRAPSAATHGSGGSGARSTELALRVFLLSSLAFNHAMVSDVLARYSPSGPVTASTCATVTRLSASFYVLANISLYCVYLIRADLVGKLEKGRWYQRFVFAVRASVVTSPVALLPIVYFVVDGAYLEPQGLCVLVDASFFPASLFFACVNLAVSAALLAVFLYPIVRFRFNEAGSPAAGTDSKVWHVATKNTKLTALSLAVTTFCNAWFAATVQLARADPAQAYLLATVDLVYFFDVWTNVLIPRLMTTLWMPRSWRAKAMATHVLSSSDQGASAAKAAPTPSVSSSAAKNQGTVAPTSQA